MGRSRLLLIGLVFAWGCKKPDDIGAGLITGANVEYYDSINVGLTTFVAEDVRTAVPALGFWGELDDPVMGLQTAAFHTQFVPLLNDIVLRNAQYDSLVLVLDVRAFRGNRAHAMRLKIHELADSLRLTTPYVITSTPTVKAEELSGGYRFSASDSAFSARKLSVRLSDELGRRLFEADSAVWARPQNLKGFFYGLSIGAVRENPGDMGCIYVSNLQTVGEVSLVLHYRIPSADTFRRAKVELFAPADAAGFYSLHTRAKPDALAQKVLDAQNPEAARYAVVQEGGQWLVRVAIDSADVARFADVAVNRAQLVLTVPAEYYSDTLEAVTPRTLVLRHARGRENRIDSLAPSISSRRAQDRPREYVFDVDDYFQQYVRNKKTFTDFIVTGSTINLLNVLSPDRSGFSRVVLGNVETEARPKIRLFYTRAPE